MSHIHTYVDGRDDARRWLQNPRNADALLHRFHPASFSTNAELPPLAAKRTLRILVVEDNRDAAHMLAQFLRLSGYAVTVAYSSGEGLEAARKTLPDIVLCDIGLPDGDGYIFAQALRDNPQTAGAQLIAVTARNREEDKQRSRDAGFQLHLVKPVRPKSFFANSIRLPGRFNPMADRGASQRGLVVQRPDVSDCLVQIYAPHTHISERRPTVFEIQGIASALEISFQNFVGHD